MQMDCKKAVNLFPMGSPGNDEVNVQINTLKENTNDVINANSKFNLEKTQLENVTNQLKLIQKNYNFKTLEQLSEYIQNQVNLQAAEQTAFMINEMLQNKSALEDSLLRHTGFLFNYLAHICMKVEESIRRVLDVELLAWKKSQRLAGIGLQSDNGQLDNIQRWCEQLTEITLANLRESKTTANIIMSQYVRSYITDATAIANELNKLTKRFHELFISLITSTFIIEKQPPQVMKTNTRFSAKLRLLVGSKLNIANHPPTAEVCIISEAQANGLIDNTLKEESSCGEITNNTGRMEFDQATSQLSITFRNMQLKKIKRADKRGNSESVVDEKFALYFSTKFSVGGNYDVSVWTMSLPVAVIVHGNQDPHAWATILWDNAFAEPGRRPFVVPEKVSWKQAAHALNLKFEAVTGRALSQDNLQYLAEKLFKVRCNDYDNMMLTWSQFSKESLPERSFTFWDWFHAVMKLTKEHLKDLWTDNTILGFVGKPQAEEILNTCRSGTFLLRFSDSELGGITVGWIGGIDDQREIIMLHPFTAKDFAIRCLADRLNDLTHLTYLYPDIPKEKAFGHHYTTVYESQSTPINGYLRPVLVTQVPGWGNLTSTSPNSACMSPNSVCYPNTPTPAPHLSIPQNSPDDSIARSSPNNTVSLVDQSNMNFVVNGMDYSQLMDQSVDFTNLMNFPVL